MINITMEGVKDAVETAKEIINPWYRQNAIRKTRLENTLRQAEIHKINAETLAAQARTERDKAAQELDSNQSKLILAQAKKTEAEALLIEAQAVKTLAEAKKEEAALRQAQIELALKIVMLYGKNLTEVNKTDFVIKLLPVIQKLTWGGIEPSEGAK